jgi:hypothetical protein
VMKKTVEDGGGNGAVAVKDSRPLLEGFVGGQHDGAALVALTDDLGKEISATLVDGEVADLVKQEERWGEISAQFDFEGAFVLGGRESVDNVDRVGEENGFSAQAGGVAEGGRQVGFSQPDGTGHILLTFLKFVGFTIGIIRCSARL